TLGAHGYYAADFDQMRGITFAIGPAFKHGYLNIPLKQIDHYQVFCHIHGLNPSQTTVRGIEYQKCSLKFAHTLVVPLDFQCL
ncbi:ectonucleotide pyrophosphatase/phosphodiesterase family member 6-like isoform X4, partial [Leptotrombidium deliense]